MPPGAAGLPEYLTPARDRDDCVVCKPDSPLVRAGNSYYTCPACRPPPVAKPKTGKRVLKPPGIHSKQKTLAEVNNGR